MNRTTIISATLAFIVMGIAGIVNADVPANNILTAQEKAYLQKVDQGHDFTPVNTVAEKSENILENNMFTQAEQDYLRAVSDGKDFPLIRTADREEMSGLVNTMFQAQDLSRLKSINIGW
ncbi:MAG: hypothetical protein SWH61_06110 [Thermodesulfobacteriota bacterium]|nr:hypothetical protein [Thermodesulfobacteriota bacterium]